MRLDPQILARSHERAPQLDASVPRVVEFPTCFAGETQPHCMARHPSNGEPTMLEKFWDVVDGNATGHEQIPSEWPGHVDRGNASGSIHDVHIEPPCLGPVAQPRFGVCRTARSKADCEPRHHRAVWRNAVFFAEHHAVVEEVTAFVENQHVTRSPRFDVSDRGRINPFEQFNGVGAADDELPQRAHVTDGDGFAHSPVLGHMIAVIPWSPPATESVHICAERKVFVMQRSALPRLGKKPGNRLAHRDLLGRGPRSERLRSLCSVGPGCDERLQMRKARRALAGAGADQRRSLHEFRLLEAPVPHPLYVFDGDLGTRARHSGGGGWR